MEKPKIVEALWKSFINKATTDPYKKVDLSLLQLRDKLKKEGKIHAGEVISRIKN